jgi:hypothetical protein
MNKLQEDKYSAYAATKLLLNMDEYKAIWMGNDDFGKLVTKMETLMEEILAEGADQDKDIKGTAAEKREIRRVLTEAAMKVVHSVTAYSVIQNNIELEKKIDFSKRELDKARDNIFAERVGVIYGIAYPLRDELGGVRLTAEDIERVNELRSDYLGVIVAPRWEIVRRSRATETLKMKFKELDDLLYGKMDVVIRIYESDYEDFVLKYFFSRKLVRTGIRHTGAYLKGRVVMAGTETGVAGARVLMYKERVTKAKKSRRRRKAKWAWGERMSDVNGYFEFLFKDKWRIYLEAEGEGFERTVMEPVMIEPGKDVEVQLAVGSR